MMYPDVSEVTIGLRGLSEVILIERNFTVVVKDFVSKKLFREKVLPRYSRRIFWLILWKSASKSKGFKLSSTYIRSKT